MTTAELPIQGSFDKHAYHNRWQGSVKRDFFIFGVGWLCRTKGGYRWLILRRYFKAAQEKVKAGDYDFDVDLEDEDPTT